MAENETYQTIAAVERHYIGADGLPLSHHTDRTVTALQPLDHITYAFDTNVAEVTTPAGITVGEMYKHGPEPDIYAVDLHLDTPMEAGETRSLTYETTFNYTQAPPAEFRRFTGSTALQELDLQVTFKDRLNLPMQACWAEWEGFGPGKLIAGSIVDWSLKPLNEEHTSPFVLQRRLTNVLPGKIVGWFWLRAPQPAENIKEQ